MKPGHFFVTSQILGMLIPGLLLVGVVSECSKQLSTLNMPPLTNLFYKTLGASGVAIVVLLAIAVAIGIQFLKTERLKGVFCMMVALTFALFLASGLYATGHALKVMLERNSGSMDGRLSN